MHSIYVIVFVTVCGLTLSIHWGLMLLHVLDGAEHIRTSIKDVNQFKVHILISFVYMGTFCIYFKVIFALSPCVIYIIVLLVLSVLDNTRHIRG